MRAAIYGAGAMGTALGAYISRAGADVEFIVRSAEKAKILSERGVRVCGEENFSAPAKAVLPEEAGEYDVVFIATKQTANGEVAERAKNLLTQKGAVCTIQNGLPEYALSNRLGDERVLGCVCSWGASLEQCGVTRLTSSRKRLRFQLGSLNANPLGLQAAQAFLSLMGEVETPQNFIGARWSKLIINGAFSPLSGISGLTFGQVARKKPFRNVALELFNEGAKVCATEGVKPEKIQGHDAVKLLSFGGAVKRAFAYAVLPLAMSKHKNIVSGIYYDLINGRESEAHAMSGVILSRGELRGVHTPYTRKALEIIEKITRGELLPAEENIKLFY